MLESLPGLKKELQKIEKSQKLSVDNKIERYQKKMLELLIREKTTILENEDLIRELNGVKQRASESQENNKNLTVKLRQKQVEMQKLRSEIQRLSQTVENLVTQNRMNQIGRLNQQEKYVELFEVHQMLQNEKNNLKNELTNIINNNNKLKKQSSQNQKLNKQQIQELNQKQLFFINQNQVTSIKYHVESIHYSNKQKSLKKNMKLNSINSVSSFISNIAKQMDQKYNQILANNQQLSKMEQRLNLAQSTENTLKQKLNESLSNYSTLQSKLQQLTKQNHLLKLKSKQFQDSLYSNEIEKGQQSLLFQKLDKENKKLKKLISQTQQKLNQIEEEKSSLEDKYQQLNKNYKNTKKELEKIQDSLSEANDYETGVKSKINKLQLIIKQSRENLHQKDQKIQSLQDTVKKITNELQSSKNEALQAKFTTEEMRKKYEVVSEARNLAQQKLVLEREENAKSLSSMIKEKDICCRQNYKLLQLLEMKDKTLDKILSGLKNTEELERQLSLEISGKQNDTKRMIDDILSKDIKGNKDRVRVIGEYLEKNKY